MRRTAAVIIICGSVLTSCAVQAQPPGGRRQTLEELKTLLLRDSVITLQRAGVTLAVAPYEHQDHKVEAILARPSDSGVYPGLVLVPGYMRSAWDMFPLLVGFAREGYVCLAVSQPGFGHSEGPPDFAGPRTVATAQTGLELLSRSPEVDSSRMGVFGYSRGAMVAGLLAVRSSRVKAAILGGGIYDLGMAYEELQLEGVRKNIEVEAGTDEESFRVRSLVFSADSLSCPLLIVHGELDQSAPVSQAYLLGDRLKELGKEYEILILPERDHGLRFDDFREAAQAFLGEYLSARAPTTESEL